MQNNSSRERSSDDTAVGVLRLDAYPGRRYLPPFDRSLLGPESLRAHVAGVLEVDPESIILASDGGALLRLWVAGWVAPAETVAVFEPTAADHRNSILAAGAYYVDCGRTRQFRARVDHLAKTLSAGTRFVLVAEPNFPTGDAAFMDEWPAVLHGMPGVQLLVDRRFGPNPVDVSWERAVGAWTLLRCRGARSGLDLFALMGPQSEVDQLARLRVAWVSPQSRFRALSHQSNSPPTVTRWLRRVERRLVTEGYSVFVGSGPFLYVIQDGASQHDLAEALGKIGVSVECPQGHIYRQGVFVWPPQRFVSPFYRSGIL